MTFHYVNISAGHTFNIDLGTAVVRAGSITTGFIERAELGEVGMGAVELDDPSGALDIVGLQRFSVSESAVGGDFVYVSQIKERTVRRGDSARASLRTGADRVWSLTLAEQNYILTNRKVFEGDGGKRPAETAAARLSWLLGITYIGIHDWGYVTYPTHAMDACDYTGQDVKSILADIAAAASYNFFGYWDQAHVGIGLWFGDPEGTSFTSSATISNVLSDVGGSCFYSLDDAVLTRSPSRIASRVRLAYTGGAVVVSNSTTLDDFDWVDQEAPMSNVKTASAATAVANAFLAASDGEDDRISVSVRVPAAHVNDILAGHRLQVKFSHLPWYGAWTWCRVMSRAVMQDEVDDTQYRIALELVPQGAGGSSPNLDCALDPSIASTPSGTYPPLGGTTTDATGNLWYTNATGQWFNDGHQPSGGPYPGHTCLGFGFPAYGPPDAGGVGVGSEATFVFSGPGTVAASWTSFDGTYYITWTLNYYGAAGPTVQSSGSQDMPGTLTVAAGAIPGDATSCYRWLNMKINGGGPYTGTKGTFSGLAWTLAP